MEYAIKNILVPTDFSETANNALNFAIAVAERHNAQLHLLHVVEPMTLGKFISVHEKTIAVQNQMISNAKANMVQLVQCIEKKRTIHVTSTVLMDKITDGIHAYEVEKAIDLTIIGTHGKSGYDEFMAGSNAINVIKKSIIPILSIPPMFTKKTFEKILYPVRIVKGTVEKYDCIKPILEKNKAKLQILGVYEFDNIEEVNEISEKIKEIRSLAQYKNVEVSYHIIPCKGIERRIISKSEEFESDLLVINSTLEKKWYHRFIGNTFTDEIINNSKIPTLSINPKFLKLS